MLLAVPSSWLTAISVSYTHLDVYKRQDETVIYKIGGTFYEVSTSCGGSEPLFEKMKRLIKSENLKTPADKGKEVRYNEDSNLSVGRSLQEE